VEYDVIIVGAGPAGVSCAYVLSQSGAKVALLEKSSFPRDKICGDALSIDVVHQLEWIDPRLAADFQKLENKLPSYGIRFVSPKGYKLDLPIIKNGVRKCGYTTERYVFDNFLLEQLKLNTSVEVFFNCTVKDLKVENNRVEISTDSGVFYCKTVVGADGAHSVVNKNTIKNPVDKDHFSAGLRQYYSNVIGFNSEQMIELHFFRELLPGYFWIFPLTGNKANVGLGVPSNVVSRDRLNLKEVLQKIIENEPSVKERFANAIPLEEVRGYGLPLGSKKRPVSANRVILTGDAAGLIDPFTGEGVANAIRSGRVAADILEKALRENDFSAKSLMRYDKELHRRIWSELKVSNLLKKMAIYPGVCDFLLKKAEQNHYVKNYLHDALADVHKRKFTTAPRFLFNLLFR